MKRINTPLRRYFLFVRPTAKPVLRIALAVIYIVIVRPVHAQLNQWTWKHGLNVINQYGIFGTMGVPASTNLPTPRHAATTWTDAYGQLWMFGGNRFTAAFTDSVKNDLWKWNGSQWTWMGGTNTVLAFANYGTQGVTASTNWPGGRSTTVSWTDAAGNVWMFGGYGLTDTWAATSNGTARLNDLWKWDGTNWTWVKGNKTYNSPGVTGTKGVPAPANIPGARNYAVCWKDASGNAWVFGGTGYSTGASVKSFNELWKWDGTNWTWVSGSNTGNTAGVYGTKGVAASANVPGSRIGAISWNDAAGNGWVFGGSGYDSAGASGLLNDLWKWDGTNWTWISGSKTVNQPGVYGTAGVTAATNMPGARYLASCWTDNNGEVWIMGGNGFGASGFAGSLNDLWKWNGTNWTWMNGSNTINAMGNYGTMGVPAATNYPGSKERPALWKDYNGNIWLFGGNGYSIYPTKGFMNDMWYYKMYNPPLPLHLLSFTGQYQQNNIALNWHTTNETNSREFIVERSTNTQSFIPVGTVAANGSGDGFYSFTDKNISGLHTLYYRLAIIDRSGNRTYSNIVQVTIQGKEDAFIFPNPAGNFATLYTNGTLYIHTMVRLYDGDGKLLRQWTIQSSAERIVLDKLPAGMYYVQLNDHATLRLLKQ